MDLIPTWELIRFVAALAFTIGLSMGLGMSIASRIIRVRHLMDKSITYNNLDKPNYRNGR